MTWIKLPDCYINLDQARRIEFEEVADRPALAVITWTGGDHQYTPHSILEGKNALCLQEAVDHFAAVFEEPIAHQMAIVDGELLEEEPCQKS